MSAINSTKLKTPSGDLELLQCLPESSGSRPAILCLHGAFCSAHDFQFLLPYFSSRGFPAYALSLRGHGNSWAPSTLRMHLTSLDGHVDDIGIALDHISEKHVSAVIPPILIGHSFGGGHLQYFLSRLGKNHVASPDEKHRVSALVLLASAPISGGGKEIMANWEQVETQGKGYKYPWSPRSQLETVAQVRKAFFQDATNVATIEKWHSECRTKAEGIRAGLAVLWPFGEASDVLAALSGIEEHGVGRKVLHIAAGRDCLVTPSMVEENTLAYQKAVGSSPDTSQTVMSIVIEDSAHHLMMDIAWAECAKKVADWVELRDISKP